MLLRFLDECLGRRPAHMRPGLRFRRTWTLAEAEGLGSALAGTIRSEFNAVFAVAHEPALGSALAVRPEAREALLRADPYKRRGCVVQLGIAFTEKPAMPW